MVFYTNCILFYTSSKLFYTNFLYFFSQKILPNEKLWVRLWIAFYGIKGGNVTQWFYRVSGIAFGSSPYMFLFVIRNHQALVIRVTVTAVWVYDECLQTGVMDALQSEYRTLTSCQDRFLFQHWRRHANPMWNVCPTPFAKLMPRQRIPDWRFVCAKKDS